MRIYLYTLLFFPTLLWGQNIAEANGLKEQALASYDKGNSSQANDLWREAAKIYEKAGEWDSFLECGVAWTSSLMETKANEKALEIAQDFAKKAEARGNLSVALSLLYKNIGKIHYRAYDNRASLEALKQALIIREKVNPKDPDLAKDYSNLGVVCNLSGRYGQAIKYLEKALKLQKDDLVLAKIYTEIGINYRYIGNFRKSLDYQSQAIKILEKEKKWKPLGNALLEKGLTLTQLKQNGIDREFIYQALDIFKMPVIDDKENQVSSYKALAYSYHQFAVGGYESKEGLDSAIANYTRALAIAQKYVADDLLTQSAITNDLANVYATQNKLAEANTYLDKTEALGNEVFEEKSVEAAAFFGTKSDLNLLEKDYTSAIENIHQRLTSLLPDYSDSNPYQNPSIDILKKGLSQDEVQNALATKARVLYKVYQQNKDKKNLEAALKNLELFDAMIDHIRSDFANSGSNLAWSDLTLDAYENAIDVCLALGGEEYKAKAFYFSEKSKGLGLLEAFQNTKANKIAGVDLEEELAVKLDIAELDQELFQLKQESTVDEAKVASLEKELFLKKERYNKMIKAIELNSPAYFDAKYKLDIMDVAAVRQLLQPDQALIEYFVGDSSIYAFKITANDFEIIKIKGQGFLGEKVYDFRESIYGYFLNNRDRNPQILAQFAQKYTTEAYGLYQMLIAPLGSLPNRLIIIPAGAMCDMPFESLISEPVKSNHQEFKGHAYFVKKHIVSYAYSATLLKEMRNKEHAQTEHTYLGFAPSFGDGSESLIRGKTYTLSPLTYNSVEIENIQKLLGEGTVFKAAEATEDKFKELASNYSIIHFATHGLANNQDPDYSLLAFTDIDDGVENEFLYVSDMYNMSLNADMVVLSACETALGKNFRGEGIMSLARGFSYAGAKSIFTTLWSVNDQATFQIVERFYKNLQRGMHKDEALQQAKVSFIEDGNDMTAHPFLWSPYIMVGDMSPLDSISGGIPWLWIGLGGLLLVVGGLAARKFTGKKTA